MKHFITKHKSIFFTSLFAFLLICGMISALVLFPNSASQESSEPQKHTEQNSATSLKNVQESDSLKETASDIQNTNIDQTIADKFENADKIVLGSYYDILEESPEDKKVVITEQSIIKEFVRLMSIKSEKEYSPEGRQHK